MKESLIIQHENAIESQRNHELLLESTEEGIYGIDTNGLCTFINQAGASMLDYTKEECIGVNMHDLVHHTRINGNPYPDSECPIYKANGSGCRVENEYFWTKNDTPLPVRYSSTTILESGKYKGAVIGLTIVKKIINNMDGKIWVESAKGEGATFFFTIPKLT